MVYLVRIFAKPVSGCISARTLAMARRKKMKILICLVCAYLIKGYIETKRTF